jgi:polyvinyl alcohol dehydrogenase (cytochrome)
MKSASARCRRLSGVVLALVACISTGRSPSSEPKDETGGADVFANVCAPCHEGEGSRAPATATLRRMNPTVIYRALTVGAMQAQARNLSDAAKKAVSEFFAGTNLPGESGVVAPSCSGSAATFDPAQPPAYSSWGLTPLKTRNVSTKLAGIDRSNVSRLRLKWAYGIPGGTRMRSHPLLAGGAICFGTGDGVVHALERQRLRALEPPAEVRTDIVTGLWRSHSGVPVAVLYFGDMIGNAYAVDARTGKKVWSDHTDNHASTTLTATPALLGNLLYVPVSSLEEANLDPKCEYCTFRGSVIAYDVATGRRVWQTYLSDAPHHWRQQRRCKNVRPVRRGRMELSGD